MRMSPLLGSTSAARSSKSVDLAPPPSRADADALSRRNVQAQVVEEGTPTRVAIGDPAQLDRSASSLRGKVLAFGLLHREIGQVAELVDGGEEIVEELEVLSELRDARHDERDDELGGNELAQSELAIDDEPAADTEKPREREGLETERAAI